MMMNSSEKLSNLQNLLNDEYIFKCSSSLDLIETSESANLKKVRIKNNPKVLIIKGDYEKKICNLIKNTYCMSDYIIFSYKYNKLYIIHLEMKSSTANKKNIAEKFNNSFFTIDSFKNLSFQGKKILQTKQILHFFILLKRKPAVLVTSRCKKSSNLPEKFDLNIDVDGIKKNYKYKIIYFTSTKDNALNYKDLIS